MRFFCPTCNKNLLEHEVQRISASARMCSVCKGPCFSEPAKTLKVSKTASKSIKFRFENEGFFSRNITLIVFIGIIGCVFYFLNPSITLLGGEKRLKELKFELFKNEIIIEHEDARITSMKKYYESLPACPRTGERSSFELTLDPRIELQNKNNELRSKIRALESKGIRCKKSDAEIKSEINVQSG